MTEVVIASGLVFMATIFWWLYFVWDDVQGLFRQAGINEEIRYRNLTSVMASCLAVMFFVFLKNPPAAVIAFVLTVSYRKRALEIKSLERKEKLDEQSEIALQIISSLYDVHKDMIRAFEGAADCVSPPMSDELKRVVIEYRAGKSIGEALTDFMTRIDNRDFEILCKGILLSEQYGTDTTAVVQEVAQIIRDRVVLREELKNELRGQKLTVDIFLLMIPLIGALLYMFSPEARQTMITTTAGKSIVVFLVAVEYIAWRFTRGQWVVENL